MFGNWQNNKGNGIFEVITYILFYHYTILKVIVFALLGEDTSKDQDRGKEYKGIYGFFLQNTVIFLNNNWLDYL